MSDYYLSHEEDDDSESDSIKVVFLGRSSVGKSSLLMRLVENKFNAHKAPTIGAAFVRCIVDGVQFDVWDTAGQERYRSMAPLYYRNAHAAIVVFDACEYPSFAEAKQWVADVESHTNDILTVICANKMDLYFERQLGADKQKHSGAGLLSMDRSVSAAMKPDVDFIDDETDFDTASNYSTVAGSSSSASSAASGRHHKCHTIDSGAIDGGHCDLLQLAVKYAIDNSFEFITTSALTGENVREMFELIAERTRDATGESFVSSHRQSVLSEDRKQKSERKILSKCFCDLL